jgi:predicted LPLAT superfamily acyltransferase
MHPMRTGLDEMSKAKLTHWPWIAEAGTTIGITIIFYIYRLLGRTAFRVLLAPVALYFFLVRTQARASSLEYISQLATFSPKLFPYIPRAITSYCQFFHFGEAILDKAISWSGRVPLSQAEVVDIDSYNLIFNDVRGRLIIGSHFGNLEFCRGFVTQHRKIVINALIYDTHSKIFSGMIKRINPDSRINLYQVDKLNFRDMLSLKKKVANGEWVVITGDRVPVLNPERHTVSASFLGRPAAFPIGPYILATLLGCPVSLLFAYRKGDRIKVNFETFAERIVLSRENRTRDLTYYAQCFASRLEEHCQIAPLQWFNFHPFWQSLK